MKKIIRINSKFLDHLHDNLRVLIPMGIRRERFIRFHDKSIEFIAKSGDEIEYWAVLNLEDTNKKKESRQMSLDKINEKDKDERSKFLDKNDKNNQKQDIIEPKIEPEDDFNVKIEDESFSATSITFKGSCTPLKVKIEPEDNVNDNNNYDITNNNHENNYDTNSSTTFPNSETEDIWKNILIRLKNIQDITKFAYFYSKNVKIS